MGADIGGTVLAHLHNATPHPVALLFARRGARQGRAIQGSTQHLAVDSEHEGGAIGEEGREHQPDQDRAEIPLQGTGGHDSSLGRQISLLPLSDEKWLLLPPVTPCPCLLKLLGINHHGSDPGAGPRESVGNTRDLLFGVAV